MIRHKYVQLQNNYNTAVLFRCYFTWESRKERERKKEKPRRRRRALLQMLMSSKLPAFAYLSCSPPPPPPSEITIVKYESVAAAGSSCRQFQLDNLDFSSASPSLARASAFVSMESRISCSMKCETVQRGGCCTRSH